MTKDTKIKELEIKLTAIQEEIEELKNHKFPSLGDRYWHITLRQAISVAIYENDTYDNIAKKTGNFFETKEEAQKELDKRILLQELKEFTDYKPDWKNGSSKFYIFYNWACKKHGVGSTQYCHKIGEIYFISKNEAQKAIEHFGDRLKVLF